MSYEATLGLAIRFDLEVPRKLLDRMTPGVGGTSTHQPEGALHTWSLSSASSGPLEELKAWLRGQDPSLYLLLPAEGESMGSWESNPWNLRRKVVTTIVWTGRGHDVNSVQVFDVRLLGSGAEEGKDEATPYKDASTWTLFRGLVILGRVSTLEEVPGLLKKVRPVYFPEVFLAHFEWWCSWRKRELEEMEEARLRTLYGDEYDND